MKTIKLQHLSPSQIIIFSSSLTIFLGIFFLSLPIARKNSLSLLDIIFTSISAATGTGMFTISLTNYTPFGHAIIILLAQIGAIGLVILSLSLVLIFFEFEKPTQLLIAEILDIERRKNIKKIIFSVIGLTIAIEIIGALLLYISFHKRFGLVKGWWYALFHSISAFANSGITLFEDSMAQFKHDPIVLVAIPLIVFAGGIGFVTLHEGLKFIPAKFKEKTYRFSLNSHVTWVTAITLFILASILYFSLENDYSLAAENPLITFLNALFNGVSSAGSGFATVSINSIRFPTLLIVMIMAFIGTAPGSTGSGIRTTTVAIALASIKAIIQGKSRITLLGRPIAGDQIRKAIAIIALSLEWVVISTFLLLIIEPHYEFQQILFEAVSSFATLGLSTGITSYVSPISKIILMINMILGKIGPFTLIFAIKKTIAPEKEIIKKEEPVLLG